MASPRAERCAPSKDPPTLHMYAHTISECGKVRQEGLHTTHNNLAPCSVLAM